jgi:hypothetical protein
MYTVHESWMVRRNFGFMREVREQEGAYKGRSNRRLEKAV